MNTNKTRPLNNNEIDVLFILKLGLNPLSAKEIVKATEKTMTVDDVNNALSVLFSSGMISRVLTEPTSWMLAKEANPRLIVLDQIAKGIYEGGENDGLMRLGILFKN